MTDSTMKIEDGHNTAALDALFILGDNCKLPLEERQGLATIIKTALANAPQVVTDEDVAKLLFNVPFPSKAQLSRVKRVVNKYPNGLRIVGGG